MTKHITVVLANRSGALADVLAALASVNVNVWALHLASAGKTGFVQLICRPHDVALQVLKSRFGYYVTEADVVALRLPHSSGQLLRVMELLAHNKVNVSQVYNTFAQGEPLILLEPEASWDVQTVMDILSKNGIQLVDAIGDIDDGLSTN